MRVSESSSSIHTRLRLIHVDKYRIVVEGNWAKFTQSKEQAQLKDMLLATGDRELVEVGFDGVTYVSGSELLTECV